MSQTADLFQSVREISYEDFHDDKYIHAFQLGVNHAVRKVGAILENTCLVVRANKGNAMPDMEEIAGQLYESYCHLVGGKAFNGDLLPSWEEFSTDTSKELQANGWRGVASKAMEIFNQ